MYNFFHRRHHMPSWHGKIVDRQGRGRQDNIHRQDQNLALYQQALVDGLIQSRVIGNLGCGRGKICTNAERWGYVSQMAPEVTQDLWWCIFVFLDMERPDAAALAFSFKEVPHGPGWHRHGETGHLQQWFSAIRALACEFNE